MDSVHKIKQCKKTLFCGNLLNDFIKSIKEYNKVQTVQCISK